MKLTIANEDLVFATNSVHRLVNTQSSLPILGNILIRVDTERAEFIASDLESNVRCSVAAKADEAFEMTVPAATFHSLVKELPDGEVSLELDKDKVKVLAQKTRYNLTTLDPIDFPKWPEFEPKATLEIKQAELKRAFEAVLFAIPQRDPRKVLLGALMDIDGLEMKCVGTDGKKLGFVKTALETHTGEEQISAVAPQKIMSEVINSLKDEDAVCTIRIGERQLAFHLGSVQFVTNKLEGTYPNYNRVIPQTFEKTIKLDRKALISGIKQAAIIAEEKNNSVKFQFSENLLKVESNTYDLGQYTGEIPLEYEGDEFEMVFNHRFVSEVLKALGQDEAHFKVNKPAAPAVFTGVDSDESLFVIMPIKLADLAEPAGLDDDD